MKTFGFIFARGNSKGIPKKNMVKINGKPLIEYSIEKAQMSNKIDELFVSTDDKGIADFVKSLGINVIVRPKALASDKSPEWLSWQHAIRYVEKSIEPFDLFVSIPTTSPLGEVSDIDNAIKKLLSSNSDICIAVTKSSRNPYFNLVEKNKKGFLVLLDNLQKRITDRQSAPITYDMTTIVYASHKSFILSKQNIFDGDVSFIEVTKERSLDIDDPFDLQIAEMVLTRKIEKKKKR